MVALYEMLRVASKGVVLIEPQDLYIDKPTFPSPRKAAYETDGNFVYTLSRSELEKVALGINLPALTFKNMIDLYEDGLSFEIAVDANPKFVNFKERLNNLLDQAHRGEVKHNMLMAMVFKEMPSNSTIEGLQKNNWDFVKLERNPFIRPAQ